MKNTIAAIATILVFGLMAWTFSKGGAYHGGEHAKGIGSFTDATVTTQVTPAEKSDEEKDAEQIKALKEKAGNIGNFKVSDEYKSKCAACHGANGSGEQDGRKLMGPKLYGQSADKIYKDLTDFKANRKENVIMRGLLINTSEEELRKFADEIGEFPSRAAQSNQ
ncbi:c-type cytochrome [Sulfurimonas crateris]|uniref:C-type cytochrome n=1 Tax=Sulfurimonas crateris TaxID=2574727 RepID=A0A4U2Z6M9_9BACT|nr:c-type cytochrome [Sulfurimonas crateris]TKI69614.1 c-type cytochrome [Sulfurimonas crateris]